MTTVFLVPCSTVGNGKQGIILTVVFLIHIFGLPKEKIKKIKTPTNIQLYSYNGCVPWNSFLGSGPPKTSLVVQLDPVPQALVPDFSSHSRHSFYLKLHLYTMFPEATLVYLCYSVTKYISSINDNLICLSVLPGGWEHGCPPQSLLRHSAGTAAPTGNHPGPRHDGQRASHPLLSIDPLQTHPNHLLPRRSQRGTVPAGKLWLRGRALSMLSLSLRLKHPQSWSRVV